MYRYWAYVLTASSSLLQSCSLPRLLTLFTPIFYIDFSTCLRIRAMGHTPLTLQSHSLCLSKVAGEEPSACFALFLKLPFLVPYQALCLHIVDCVENSLADCSRTTTGCGWRKMKGAVRCGAVRCGAVRCGAVRCGAVEAFFFYRSLQ